MQKELGGQLSLEFLLLLAIVFTFLSTTTMPLYQDSKTMARELTQRRNARDAAQKISSGLETVYIDGLSSEETVNYWLPDRVENVKAVPIDNRVAIVVYFQQEDETENAISRTMFPAKWENQLGIENIDIVTGFRREYETTFILESFDPEFRVEHKEVK